MRSIHTAHTRQEDVGENALTSRRMAQWTVMMTKPWTESKTAKRTWRRGITHSCYSSWCPFVYYCSDSETWHPLIFKKSYYITVQIIKL